MIATIKSYLLKIIMLVMRVVVITIKQRMTSHFILVWRRKYYFQGVRRSKYACTRVCVCMCSKEEQSLITILVYCLISFLLTNKDK